ncbi:MAG: energy-coupled thiamine transporter ThiT [Candidatus Scatosoma sp.]
MSSLLLSSYLQKVYDENGDRIGYLYEELWTEYASSLLGKVFLFAALFLAVALIVVGVFVRKKKAENMPSFVKTATATAVTFAVTVIVTMLAVGFGKIGEKGYMSEKPMLLVLIPPMILAAVAIIGGIATYISFLYSKKAGKTALYITFGALAAALIAALVCLAVYFNQNVKNDGYYDTEDGTYGTVNQLILYVASAVLVIVALAVAFFTDKKGTFTFDSKSLALAGVCVSLSFALSYIKLWDLPQGGSVTLVSLLPVMLFSYLCGTKKGVFVGLVYGLLQSMQDPYIIHPAQFLLDYPVAFAMTGLAGVLKNVKAVKLPQVNFALGALFAGVMRYVAHTVSGVFAFSAYAIDAGAKNAFVYSAAYNSFVFVDVLLVLVAGVILFSSKSFVAETKKFASAPRNAADAQSAEDTAASQEQ